MLNIKKINTEEKSNGVVLKIIKGSVFSVIISLALLLLLAVVFTYTNIPEKNIPIAIIIISAVSIFTGSIVSTKKIKNHGLVNGSFVGSIYILVMYFISSCIIGDYSLNLKSIIMFITSVIAGMLGGIVGVNINKQ